MVIDCWAAFHLLYLIYSWNYGFWKHQWKLHQTFDFFQRDVTLFLELWFLKTPSGNFTKHLFSSKGMSPPKDFKSISVPILFLVPPFKLQQVRAAVNKEIAKLMAWSLHYAALGVYPHRGFYDEPFESNTYRASVAGQPVAGEYKPLGTPQCFYFSTLNWIVRSWFRMPKLKNKKHIPSTNVFLSGWSTWRSRQTWKHACSATS